MMVTTFVGSVTDTRFVLCSTPTGKPDDVTPVLPENIEQLDRMIPETRVWIYDSVRLALHSCVFVVFQDVFHDGG